MFPHNIDFLDRRAAGYQGGVQRLKICQTNAGIERLLHHRRPATGNQKHHQRTLVAPRHAVQNCPACRKTFGGGKRMSPHERFPFAQRAARHGFRANQDSVDAKIRRHHGLAPFRHRHRCLAKPNHHDLAKLTQVNVLRSRANPCSVSLQSSRDRGLNINRRQRLLKNSPSHRFQIVFHRGHFNPSASLFNAFGGVRPSKKAATFCAAKTIIRVLVSTVALPMCGARIASRRAVSFGLIFGSCSKTSRAAPAMILFSSASASASSSTTGPRDVLIKNAVRFIFSRFSFEIRCRVCGFSGTCKLTKSDSLNSLSCSTNSAFNSFSTSTGARLLPEYSTRIPKPSPRFATHLPMRPNPIIPSVFPYTSAPNR